MAPVSDPASGTAALEVSTTPSGASLLVDDQPHGVVPTMVALAPRTHTVTLEAPDALPQTRQVVVTPSGTRLDVTLWRSHPTVQYLRPVLPGGALVDARFLDDGDVGLVLQLPGGELQAWKLDPEVHLASQRLGAIAA